MVIADKTIDRTIVINPARALVFSAALWLVAPASALTNLLYDDEPNNAPHEAIALPMPDGKDAVRIIGSLEGNDQDAYRLVVDEDQAGKRIDIALTGRSGALTRLDIFDFSELADGSGRIPAELTRPPTQIWSIRSEDGSRAVQDDALLLAPGVYVLGVSHSGGAGTYSVELSQFDDTRIKVLDEPATKDAPEPASNRGRTVAWTQGEAWYAFEIREDQAGQAWDVAFQTPADHYGQMWLMGPDAAELLAIETAGGLAVVRPGLLLDPGRYLIRTAQEKAGVQMLDIQAGAPPPIDGVETEPNDTKPMPVAFGEPVSGRFDEGDTDWLGFTVDAEQAAQRYRLVLRGPPEVVAEVCLMRPAIGLTHCKRGSEGLVELHSLGLTPGRYQLRMYDRARKAPSDWQLSWTALGPVRPGEETEPNDTIEHPVAIHERGFGRGNFEGGRDTDHWRLSVTGEPQLWRMQLQGDDLFELTLKSGSGRTIASERAGRSPRIRLDNIFLLPGDYLLSAAGDSGEYTLRTQPLGPPPPGMEREPNDDMSDAGRLRFGQSYFGTLAEEGDSDRYRFTLLGHERIRITVEPPVDGSIRGLLGVGDLATAISDIRNQGKPGAALEWDVFLPPGEYYLSLEPGQVSDAEYTVRFERGDWLEEVADREPNDVRDEAAPFPRDGMLAGTVGKTNAARDWFRLPAVDAATQVEWPNQSGVRFEVFTNTDPGQDVLTLDRERDAHVLDLLPGQDYWLSVRGSGDYAVDLSALASVPPADVAPATVAIALQQSGIQAFSEWMQRLNGEIVIDNATGPAREVALAAHLTDMRWRIADLPRTLRLDAGEVRRVPFRVDIAPDAVAVPSVQLSARVSDAAGAANAVATIEPDVNAAPASPAFHWSVPEELRGGFNAADLRFGAEPVESPGYQPNKMADIRPLFDGLARHGRWTEASIPTRGDTPDEFGQPTVRLAGDAPVPVRGFLLNPTSTLDVNRFLGEFAVAVSLDGEQFRTVLQDRLAPLAVEQAFVLDEPVQARFVRLMPLGAAYGEASRWGTVRLGEFKVVAESGWRPAPGPINVVDPELGGHLVWADPWVIGSGFDKGMLIEDGKAPFPRMLQGSTAQVVLGFEHARSARVASLSIKQAEAASAGGSLEAVRIYVADRSPTGPWREVAAGELDVDTTEIALAEPAWARYVRLQFDVPEGSRSALLPDRIAIFEAEGPSALGEWGHLASAGPREAAETPVYSGLEGPPDNDSRERAIELAAGEPAPGRALLDEYASWYRISMPVDRNRLTLSLEGQPTLEGSPRLVDAAGEPVELYSLAFGPGTHTWEAWPEPGGTYYLEVFEPPRSVIFSWDTSGSVAAWLPTISNALLTYAETIKPGRDEVNLLPFGRGQPMLENWTGHPYPLMRMLAAYPEETSSSNAEGTLAVAAREMIGRPGKKAVLLLTDAATTSDATLWPSLHEGRPQVFAMKLSSEGAFGGDPVIEVDLMQDWSQVRGGHFEYVTGLGSLARGFDRAVARLKRPVDFSVTAEFEQVEAPSPATLAVTGGDDGLAPEARGAVEIILDASGSMLKRMDGERRIEIAKAAIQRTVAETLPDGLPLALRVYGHREAGSCRTDLEIPLAPLDKASFLDRVSAIQAVNLARTPIADSLKAVAADLVDADGRKLVILLTDGEETCEGDPAAEIRAMQESGFDVRVNIVGFAIDDDELKRQFAEWAELGGGSYLDAGQADALGDALAQSLSVPFVVTDAGGEEIARGQVDGEPVEVPPGSYTLRIETAQPRIVRDVSLAPGDARTIKIE